MAGREAMNMGSRTSNIISDLKSGISSMRQETSLLKQEWNSLVSVMGSGLSRFQGVFGGGYSGPASSTQVARTPVFNAPAITQMSAVGTGLVAAGPSMSSTPGGGFSAGGPTNLTSFVSQNPSAGTLYQPVVGAGGQLASSGSGFFGGGGSGNNTGLDYNNSGGSPDAPVWNSLFGKIVGGGLLGAFAGVNIAKNFLPSTAQTVEANLLLQRSAYFGGAGAAGAGGYATMGALQANIANQATLAGSDQTLDTLRAMVAAQSYGIVSPNFQSVLGGAANVSNLLPGIGMEGAMRATGAMQQARNVNMLRGIGIKVRDENGNLTSPDVVIDQIWDKICRDFSQAYGKNEKPKPSDVQIALQPGNSLDSMLNQYFGNDPMLKQLIANGLIYKAQSGGAITKAGVSALGGTTEAALSLSERNAAMAARLAGVGMAKGAAELGAQGFTDANKMITVNILSGLFEKMIVVAQQFKALTDTLLAAAGGAPGDIMSILAGKGIGNIPGFANGGYVDGSQTYLVGERGPELFRPNTPGYIIPNNKISETSTAAGDTYYNFTINVPNGNPQEVTNAIKNLIAEMETNKKVSES